MPFMDTPKEEIRPIIKLLSRDRSSGKSNTTKWYLAITALLFRKFVTARLPHRQRRNHAWQLQL
jgi:hypothetical protein